MRLRTVAGGDAGTVFWRTGSLASSALLARALLVARVPGGCWFMAKDNHREPPWVVFLSGDEEAKPVAAQLIRDAGFDPVDLGGIDDSRLQDLGGVAHHPHLRRGEGAPRTDKVRRHGRGRPVGAPDAGARAGHAIREAPRPPPDDPAFFLEQLSRSVFQAGMNLRVVEAKWHGIAVGSLERRRRPRRQPADQRRTGSGSAAALHEHAG
jgi:hypothetical protein